MRRSSITTGGLQLAFVGVLGMAACSADSTMPATGDAGANEPENSDSNLTGDAGVDAKMQDAGKPNDGSSSDVSTTDDDAGPNVIPTGSSMVGGLNHACALLPNGGVKCWGAGSDGQLGNGAFSHSDVPVQVSNLSGATALAAGEGHTCAVVAGGKVKCWGNGEYGQIGDGNPGFWSVPSEAQGITGATAIAAGGYHTCAVVAGGKVKCWGGYDYHNALGNPNHPTSNTPVDAVGITDVVSIAAGKHHTCVVTSGGHGYCWGFNPWGATSLSVANAVALSTKDMGTCFVLSDGTLKCHGDSKYQIWSTAAVGGIANAVDVAVGDYHGCALLTGGTVKCWGKDENQVGDLSTLSGVVAIGAGANHTCARLATGNVKCWGYGVYGNLGDGQGKSARTPVDALNVP